MKFEFVDSLDGMNNIGYKRKDSPLFHVIHKAPPGSSFKIGNHFDICQVCKFHEVTLKDFDYFMSKKALAK